MNIFKKCKDCGKILILNYRICSNNGQKVCKHCNPKTKIEIILTKDRQDYLCSNLCNDCKKEVIGFFGKDVLKVNYL